MSGEDSLRMMPLNTEVFVYIICVLCRKRRRLIWATEIQKENFGVVGHLLEITKQH